MLETYINLYNIILFCIYFLSKKKTVTCNYLVNKTVIPYLITISIQKLYYIKKIILTQ